MTSILRSIALRFPLLLGSIVLAVALVTGRLAQMEIGDALLAQAHGDLRSAVDTLARMLAQDIPPAKQRLLEIAADTDIVAAFAATTDETSAQRRLERFVERSPTATRVAMRLLQPDGAPRASWSGLEGATSMGWTVEMLRDGTLPVDSAVIGPVIAIADTLPGFVALVPVHDAAGAVLGYLEEVHVARGSGVAQIRALIEVERLLLGSRDWTVWTDLQRIVAGPEFTDAQDSLQRVVGADGAAVFGVARAVPGTRWMVWVERPEEQVLAPVDAFLRRMWGATLFIALTGALLAWLLARYLSSRIRHVAEELDRTLSAHGAPPASADGNRGTEDELRQLERAYAALEVRVEQRRHLDEQVLQAQKLEAVGRLAGGIAHDFNNLLTVMASYAAMAREGLPPASAEAKDIDEVLKAVDRATALTRQLLAFSRQHLTDVHPLNLNEVVRATESMLARLIPSNVQRDVRLAENLPFVVADHTQLEQVLVNLVVNAVDAMPDGGRLTLQTSVERRAGLGKHAVSLAAEDCVCLTIADTGVGMDAATVARVFDPFFTTKPLGKGTGLGLATVHGIVDAMGGRIEVTSTPGKGTVMRVVMPTAAEAASGPVQPRPPLAIAGEQLTPGLIVVAEDEPSTRTVIRRILEAGGHRVEAHETADAALASLRSRGDVPLPLAVITDVMMPGLNGIAFTALLRDEFPTLPVVLVSGYADVGDRVPDDLAKRPVILEKPFTARALYDAVRRAVGASASGREA